jgi:paraquat-inducible protein B
MMAKQANTMMIGGFVVIAALLLAVSVVLFGSGKFFKQTDKYVLYFDSSLKGLNVGAPVLFKGVQVGSVTSIVTLADHEQLTFSMPVHIEVDPKNFQVVVGDKKNKDLRELVPKFIDKGLRGVLTMQSFITGQLMIELAYYPNTPVNLKEKDSQILEIPTIPSTAQRLFHVLQNIDLKGLLKHVEHTLAGVDTLVNNPELAEGIHDLRLAAANVKDITSKIDGYVDPVVNSLEGTLTDTRKLMNNLDRQVEPLSSDLRKAIEDFDRLTRNTDANLKLLTTSLDKSLAGFRGVVSEDAPLVIKLEETLQDISRMVSSLRQLAEYLEQHPESLLKGKDN